MNFNKFLIGLFTVSALMAISQPAFPDAVIFSGSDVKTLKPNIDLYGQSKILSGTVDPTSSATSAPIGSIYLNSSNGNVYKKQDAGSSTNWVKVSSGGDAGVNYIANPNAEQATTGWSTYADAAQNTPVDATGGSPSSTWTRTTTTPLSGTGAFLWTRTAANRQGEGVSYPFTINNSDQGRVLAISFDYKNVSGTFFAADGTTAPLNDGTTSQNAGMSDLEVFMYDVTNSLLIPVTPQVLTCTSTTSCQYKGTFQTASNSTSYRFALHTARSTAVAFTEQFDNFFVGPQAITNGPVSSDWLSYTPTVSAGLGTVTNNSAYYRRQGDSLEVHATFTVGTTAASIASISLPSGLNVDSNKLSINNTTANPGVMVGKYQVSEATANVGGSIITAPSTSTSVVYFGQSDVNASSHLTPANGTGVTASSVVMSVYFKVPVQGWSGTSLMSNDTDTRVIALRASTTVATALSGSATDIPFATVSYDSSGTYASPTYTVPVSGYYQVDVKFQTGSNLGGTTYLVKNGSTVSRSGAINITGQTSYILSDTVQCVAGDTLKIQADSAGTPTLSTNAGQNTLSIKKVTGPATIASSDTYSARYYATATSISGSLATISWTTKDFDDHLGMSSGTYILASSGKYQVNTCLAFTANSAAAGNAIDVQVQKNGSVVSEAAPVYQNTQVTLPVCLSDVISGVAGDTIRVQASSAATTPSITSSNSKNYFSIVRVGN